MEFTEIFYGKSPIEIDTSFYSKTWPEYKFATLIELPESEKGKSVGVEVLLRGDGTYEVLRIWEYQEKTIKESLKELERFLKDEPFEDWYRD